MRQYAVVKTVGDKEEVLARFDNRDDAVAFGRKCYESAKKGILAVEYADFDDNGNFRDHNRRVFETWKLGD